MHIAKSFTNLFYIVVISKGLATYRFLYVMRHNDPNKMTLPPPAFCVIPRFLAKSIVF